MHVHDMPRGLRPGPAIPSLLAFALASSLLSGCYEFQPAPDTPELSKVVSAVESVLKERYYQTRVHAASGHAYAVSAIEQEGSGQVIHRVDVQVMPIRTGHYMPRVSVRKYVDVAEPPIERGDAFLDFDPQGNPFPGSNWQPLYYDRAMAEEIRDAILEKLNVPT